MTNTRKLLILVCAIAILYFSLRQISTNTESAAVLGNEREATQRTKKKDDIKTSIKSETVKIAPDTETREPRPMLAQTLPQPVGSEKSWVEDFPGLNTYKWIFREDGDSPEKRLLLGKYTKNPYDGLLDKIVDLENGRLIVINSQALMEELGKHTDARTDYQISFQNGSVIESPTAAKDSSLPLCTLTVNPKFQHIERLKQIMLFVQEVQYPVSLKPNLIGTRLYTKERYEGDSHGYGIERIDCLIFEKNSDSQQFNELKLVHLLMTIGSQ